MKPKKEEEKEKEEIKRTRSIWKIKKTKVKPTLWEKEIEEERKKVDAAPDSIRIKSRKPRARKVLGKICAKQIVCKPEICCADLEGETALMRVKKKKKRKENGTSVPFFSLVLPVQHTRFLTNWKTELLSINSSSRVGREISSRESLLPTGQRIRLK